jgi:LVIVD repeat
MGLIIKPNFMKVFYCLLSFIFLSSCWGKKYYPDTIDYSKKVIGWKPIYGADSTFKKVKYYNTPRSMSQAGKIYVFGNAIFQNDIGKGIHIINNTIPANAQRVAFIELGGNTDIAIKGNFLYANNYNDMVVIDITTINAPIEVKRFKNTFNTNDVLKPYIWQAPKDTGYYECPQYYNDSIIINWVKDSVKQNCRR